MMSIFTFYFSFVRPLSSSQLLPASERLDIRPSPDYQQACLVVFHHSSTERASGRKQIMVLRVHSSQRIITVQATLQGRTRCWLWTLDSTVNWPTRFFISRTRQDI
ncbi:hypothetical protein BGZ63DRAFT_35396 [Mariannaea sp. PMI_226]|nr:hypothetical protein BGZ63DRAFT_35396 [Mariannaea sp. PMI_226]